MKPARIVTGEYSRHGYTALLCHHGNVRTVYQAGNNPRDSQAAGPDRLNLRQIRQYCVKTCREIAAERHAGYGGVTRVPEEESP